MEFKELLEIHERLEARVNAYWTYWSVVVVAIGGWLFAGKGGLTAPQTLAVVAGAMVFFFCNLVVLYNATALAVGVLDEVRLRADGESFLSQRLRKALSQDFSRSRLLLTVLLHLVIDAVVVAVILNSS